MIITFDDQCDEEIDTHILPIKQQIPKQLVIQIQFLQLPILIHPSTVSTSKFATTRPLSIIQ